MNDCRTNTGYRIPDMIKNVKKTSDKFITTVRVIPRFANDRFLFSCFNAVRFCKHGQVLGKDLSV